MSKKNSRASFHLFKSQQGGQPVEMEVEASTNVTVVEAYEEPMGRFVMELTAGADAANVSFKTPRNFKVISAEVTCLKTVASNTVTIRNGTSAITNAMIADTVDEVTNVAVVITAADNVSAGTIDETYADFYIDDDDLNILIAKNTAEVRVVIQTSELGV